MQAEVNVATTPLMGRILCRACGHPIALWEQVGRRTCIREVDRDIYRARLQCPKCGAWTTWSSQLVSAVRLGIAE